HGNPNRYRNANARAERNPERDVHAGRLERNRYRARRGDRKPDAYRQRHYGLLLVVNAHGHGNRYVALHARRMAGHWYSDLRGDSSIPEPNAAAAAGIVR